MKLKLKDSIPQAQIFHLIDGEPKIIFGDEKGLKRPLSREVFLMNV